MVATEGSGEMAKKILIVEDNKHLREILASVLHSSGYTMLEAATGAQGIEKAVAEKPNLILLDLDLPDITGIDAARVLKNNPATAEIPIIACSALSGSEWREEALRAGIADYLQKPISLAMIKAKIEEFIRFER
jgi:two-component system, cell cycle response regulator DivK